MKTWPQVHPYEAAFRAQWPSGLPGRGDESTWPTCTGHPNDPRTPEPTDDEAAALNCIDSLNNVQRWAKDAMVEIETHHEITPTAMGYLEDIRAELADYTGRDK